MESEFGARVSLNGTQEIFATITDPQSILSVTLMVAIMPDGNGAPIYRLGAATSQKETLLKTWPNVELSAGDTVTIEIIERENKVSGTVNEIDS